MYEWTRLKKIKDENNKTHSCPIISLRTQSMSHLRDEVKSIPSIVTDLAVNRSTDETESVELSVIWSVSMVWQVTTLVELIEQLRSMKLTSVVHAALTCWADATRQVDACRRDEIANAINRHRTKNYSQSDKDKGYWNTLPDFVIIIVIIFFNFRKK